MRGLTATLVGAAALTVPTSASAALYAGGVDDPRDPVEASRDIERLDFKLDTTAGTTSYAVRFYAAPSEATASLLRLFRILTPGCPTSSANLTSVHWDTYSSPSAGTGSYVIQGPGSGRGQKFARSFSTDGRTLTLTVTGNEYIASTPCPLSPVRFGKANVTYDQLPSIPLREVSNTSESPTTATAQAVAQAADRGGVALVANGYLDGTWPSPLGDQPPGAVPPATPTSPASGTTPQTPGSTPATPNAAGAPRLMRTPYLGLRRGRITLDAQFNARPKRLAITIAGRSVRVLLGSGGSANRYQPALTVHGARANRKYQVRITATFAGGKTVTFTRRLALHKSFKPIG